MSELKFATLTTELPLTLQQRNRCAEAIQTLANILDLSPIEIAEYLCICFTKEEFEHICGELHEMNNTE